MKNRLLLLASLVVFASCQERDSSVAVSETDIPISARLVATGAVPGAEKVRVRLTVDGQVQTTQFFPYSPGGQIELGHAPRNALLAFDLRAFSVAGSDTLWKWFASSSGRADSIDRWSFPEATIRLVATSSSAGVPSTPDAGQSWKLPAGTWYTTNGTNPRDPTQRSTARAGSPPDSIDLLPGMVVRAVLRTAVADGDTIVGDTVRLEVPATSVPLPTFDPDTAQLVDAGQVVHIRTDRSSDTILFRYAGESTWIHVDSFVVDQRQVEVRALRGPDTSRVRTGTWTLRVVLPGGPTLEGPTTVDPGQVLQITVPNGYFATYALRDTLATPTKWPDNGLTAPDTSFVLWLRGISIEPTKASSSWSRTLVSVRRPDSVRLTAGSRSYNTDTVWVRIQADSGNVIRVVSPGATTNRIVSSGDSVAVLVDQTLKAWTTLGSRVGDTATFTPKPVAPPPPQVVPSGGGILVGRLVTLAPSIPGDVILYSINGLGWTSFTTPFALPPGDSVVLRVWEIRNGMSGLNTLVFQVRAGASRVAPSGCIDVCNPGDRLLLTSPSDSIEWVRDGGTWTPYKDGVVLSSSGTYRFRAIQDRDTSAVDSVSVRVVYPLTPILQIVGLAQTAATVQVGPRQSGDSVVYQIGSQAPVGTIASVNVAVAFQDTVKAWSRRGTATSSDTARLVASSLGRPNPSLAAGTYASKRLLQFTLPVGSLTNDQIQLSADSGKTWTFGKQFQIESVHTIWARTVRAPPAGDTLFSDTLKGTWTVIYLRPPRIVVPLARVLHKGDYSKVRLDSLDANATSTEWRLAGGVWRKWNPTLGFDSTVFSLPNTWVRLEARSLRDANGLGDTSGVRRDSVMVRDMASPVPLIDSGTFQKDSLLVKVNHVHCPSCVVQVASPGLDNWADLVGDTLRPTVSTTVRMRLRDSTRSLFSAEVSRSYKIIDLAAAVTLTPTATFANSNPVTLLQGTCNLDDCRLEVFRNGAWKALVTEVFTSNTNIPYRAIYLNVQLQGFFRVEIIDPRVAVETDATTGKVTLKAATGRIAEYSVTGDGKDAVWSAAGWFNLVSTGRVWLRSCVAGGGACAAARDTILTWPGNAALRAAVGKADVYWILPNGHLATSGSLSLTSPKDPVDLVLANEGSGLVRYLGGKIEAWGDLSTLLSETDRSMLAEATEVSLLGAKGLARTAKGEVLGFGGNASAKFSDVASEMNAANATRFAQGYALGYPMVALADRDGSVRLCVEDRAVMCATVSAPLGLPLAPQVVRLQLHAGRILVAWDSGEFQVFQIDYEPSGTLNAKAGYRGKWAGVTPILVGTQVVVVQNGRMESADLAAGTPLTFKLITSALSPEILVPGYNVILMRDTNGSVTHLTFLTSSGWIASPLPEWAAK